MKKLRADLTEIHVIIQLMFLYFSMSYIKNFRLNYITPQFLSLVFSVCAHVWVCVCV
jgi:hypothetical protein